MVECQYLECLKILLDHGAQANVVDVNNSTSLHLAAANGDTDAAVLLLEREAKVDAKDKVFWMQTDTSMWPAVSSWFVEESAYNTSQYMYG